MNQFLEDFDSTYSALGQRLSTMKKALTYLESVDNPRIIETGTTRKARSDYTYASDGAATLIFNDYLGTRYDTEKLENQESPLITIDISLNACKMAMHQLDDWVTIICSDSIPALCNLKEKCDLLYLDSFDLPLHPETFEAIIGPENPSAEHHLKELLAAKHLLKDGTLIMIDDASPEINYGKAGLLKEFFDAIGIEPFFNEYQIGWIWKEELDTEILPVTPQIFVCR